MTDIKRGMALACVLLAVMLAVYLKTYNADYVVVTDTMAEQAQAEQASNGGLMAEELSIVHVYEDGCIEVMVEVDGDIRFYCVAEFE